MKNTRKKDRTKVVKEATRKHSLKHQAFERIRFDIVTYVLKPGEKISEADLRRRYGLGHAPLRSALQRLVEQGLVTNRRRLGHIVTPITIRDIRNIFELRRILEPRAVELIVGRLDDKQLRAMRESCRTTYSYTTQESKKKVEFLLANREFCMIIARSCQNERLGAAIEHLQDLTLRILYLGLHPKMSKNDEGFQANNATPFQHSGIRSLEFT